MIKAVLIGISVLVGCFTTVFFSRYIEYRISASELEKMPSQQLVNFTYLYKNGTLSNSNYNQSHPVLKSLTKLIEIPFIGQFFMDEKVYELAKLQHWQAIVDEAKYIVQTPANKFSFQVWYHKALAECGLGLMQECQDSVKEVGMLAGNKYHRAFSAGLYQYLQSMKKGAVKKQDMQLEL